MAARSGGTHADHIADRRRRVAAFRLRGLTQREIVKALPEVGILNPQTGKPYTLTVINNDLQAIRDDWKSEATEAMDQHIATVLAEIREVRRRAWANQDLDTVLKGLKQERDLLGLDAPEKLHHTGDLEHRHRGHVTHGHVDLSRFNDDELEQLERLASRYEGAET